MSYYYWNANSNQQQPNTAFPQFQFPTQTQQTQQTQPQFQFPTQPPSQAQSQQQMNPMAAFTAAQIRGEESYIENILRLNKGKEAVFFFTVPSAEREGGNTVEVRGVVVEAGRDHAVIREFETDHYFLFPMIYFDFARFEEPITYLNNGMVMNQRTR
ncbi:spore coat protein GerQ [Ureibacillus acetophenoni]|uniref:Spore coat protein GerQ n=1 Tax=Ureibacillus acetophenoni TaxID=614649 RepID=A0A285TYB3_9BACL|nr:spore coat protein GerQ [Ureibacillus acetophenoni]SOC34674.1 spore coat protein GerQ [Ureibacillus acetophenoni]